MKCHVTLAEEPGPGCACLCILGTVRVSAHGIVDLHDKGIYRIDVEKTFRPELQFITSVHRIP